MQWPDALCYAVLAITITASCIRGETKVHKCGKKTDRHAISRRNVILDNYEVGSDYSQPRVVIRRVGQPKPRANSAPKNARGKVRSKFVPTHGRKPYKRRGNYINPKYVSYKTRILKPQSIKTTYKAVHGKHHKKTTQDYAHYRPAEPIGFAEPPPEVTIEYPKTQLFPHQPILDSYGTLLNPVKQIHNSNIMMNTQQFFNEEQDTFGSEHQSWHQFPKENENIHDKRHDNRYETTHDNRYETTHDNRHEHIQYDNRHESRHENRHESRHGNKYDNRYDAMLAPTKKRPIYIKFDSEEYEPPFSSAHDNAAELNTYPSVYKYKPHQTSDKQSIHLKTVNRWPPKLGQVGTLGDAEVVGGQYAEPPARFVTKFQPSAPMYDGDDFKPARIHDGAPPISPYVNYKNSNMAFSPQNLNDAFST